jgi:hypothetical protein
MLSLTGDLTADRTLGALGGSPHLGRLSGLTLFEPRCTDAGLAALGRAGALPNLQELVCQNVGRDQAFTARGVLALLDGDHLPRLSRLTLAGIPPPRLALDEVFADPAAARLTQLALSTPGALPAVARSWHLSGLESLRIDGADAPADDRDVNALVDNPALARLREVHINNVSPVNGTLSKHVLDRARERFGGRMAVVYNPLPRGG